MACNRSCLAVHTRRSVVHASTSFSDIPRNGHDRPVLEVQLYLLRECKQRIDRRVSLLSIT